jgi:hypothetical protein
MNTMQQLNSYDTASQNLGMGVSEMISSGFYRLVQVIERAIRVL